MKKNKKDNYKKPKVLKEVDYSKKVTFTTSEDSKVDLLEVLENFLCRNIVKL